MHKCTFIIYAEEHAYPKFHTYQTIKGTDFYKSVHIVKTFYYPDEISSCRNNFTLTFFQGILFDNKKIPIPIKVFPLLDVYYYNTP